MKTPALFLSALLVGVSLAATDALAVDNVTSREAPDLTAVRAKIKAKDYKAALAELTPMLETHQHADVYNLMGFSLRKSGDYKQAYTFYRKALGVFTDLEKRSALRPADRDMAATLSQKISETDRELARLDSAS